MTFVCFDFASPCDAFDASSSFDDCSAFDLKRAAKNCIILTADVRPPTHDLRFLDESLCLYSGSQTFKWFTK